MYSSQFLKAARSLERPNHFSAVHYYLYCRSIELSLKSFLLCSGVSITELKGRTLGHDLVRVWKRASKLGISTLVKLSKSQMVCLCAANTYYKSKGFEYFDILKAVQGFRDRPDLDMLDSLASELVNQLKKSCTDAADIPPETEI